MKKIIAIVAAVLLGTAAFAQDSGWSVGGGINFLTFKDAEGAFSISPDVCYALNDTYNVGASLSIRKGSWDFSPYLRWYFGGTEKVFFFSDVFFDLWSEKEAVSKDWYTSWGFGVDAGVEIALTDKLCVDFYLGNVGYNADEQMFGLNVGPVQSIAFYYSF